MGNKNTGNNFGNYLFLLVMSAINLIGLSFLGVWAFHNNSIRGGVIVSIFGLMTISGLLLFNVKGFDAGKWGTNCLSFTIGLFTWLIIGSAGSAGTKSILAISKNNLFASISSALPIYLEFTLNTFVIPPSEEIFFLFGLPSLIITIFAFGTKKYPVATSKVVQLFVIIIASGALFAIFHVGKLFLAFLFAAFLFRAIMITAVFGDAFFNIIPFLKVVAGFAIGAHIGNNWGDFGVAKGFDLLFQNFWISGWFILLILGIIILSGVDQVGRWLIKGGKTSDAIGRNIE